MAADVEQFLYFFITWRLFQVNLAARGPARAAGAGVLSSEDLQHGSVIAGVPVVNPFLET
jgi:predicted nucleic acid-binding protein